jgi:hypothetical protein
VISQTGEIERLCGLDWPAVSIYGAVVVPRPIARSQSQLAGHFKPLQINLKPEAPGLWSLNSGAKAVGSRNTSAKIRYPLPLAVVPIERLERLSRLCASGLARHPT